YGNGEGYVEGQLGFDGHTQTAYANAIYMELLEDENYKKAGVLLAGLVKDNGNKLTTGFLGFKQLLPALSKTGNSDLAYTLLLSTEYPSLGFKVVNGATSIWERWDSYIKAKGFEHNASMNSFSHYSFGSVNEWMFQNMGGITTQQPGYRTFTVKPEIAREGVGSVDVTYRSINGLIKSSWKKQGSNLYQNITVPVNTKATVYIYATDKDNVEVNGKKLRECDFSKIIGEDNDHLIVELGSGKYEFTSKNMY